MTRLRAGMLGSTALLVGGLAVAAPAAGHGLSVRQDIPIPTWLFGWGAAMVLVVSFVGLAVLWPRPRLQEDSWRPLPAWFSRVVANRAVDFACGAFGVFLFWLVVYAGFRGSEVATDNFATPFVYIILWLLPLPLSVLFGDVFHAFNPWRAMGRAAGWVATRAARDGLPSPLPYPARLGYWPAAGGILAFVWLEVASPEGDRPSTVALAALIYTSWTFVGMALYGVERWISRGEAFSVYFNLISRISVFERRGDEIGVRRLLSGLTSWPTYPGCVALLATLIGTVSFDGFSAGPTWNDTIAPEPIEWFRSLGISPVRSIELTYGLGMLAAVLLVGGLYRLGIEGARSVGGDKSGAELAREFAHSLAPIALVYAAAHYVSFLVLQGQSIIPLASDPLGRGSDLFGTASVKVDYGLLGSSAFWYIQVGLVIAGHVAALVLAHDRAVAIYDDPRTATRSQYWMLAVMITFTSLALWLLSEASKG